MVILESRGKNLRIIRGGETSRTEHILGVIGWHIVFFILASTHGMIRFTGGGF